MRAVILLFLAATALSAAALPQIPDSLTRTDSKAAWMMEHVRDDFDFDDCAAYADELGVGERVATDICLIAIRRWSMSNFISGLPMRCLRPVIPTRMKPGG